LSEWYKKDFWLEHIYPGDRESVIKSYSSSTASNNTHQLEYRMINSNREICWIHVDVKVFMENDKPVLLQGFMFDITDKQYLDEITRRSQKMDAVCKITGGIAHDFNNQLGVIQGYLSFLEEYTEGSEKPHHWVELATKATRRCIDLSRSLLNFSRQHQMEEELLDVGQAIEGMTDLIVGSVTPDIEIKFQFADDLWPVEVNPGEFKEALLNLVLNARDAMPNGGVLSITAENYKMNHDRGLRFPGLDSGDYIRIDVADTGFGISNDDWERVFEPFFTTKENGKSAGLGLSMVYSFVKRSGGVVVFDSSADKGTVFNIYLPRYKNDSPKAGAVLEDGSKDYGNAHGETILVVDDEDELRVLAVAFLEMFGYKTLQADSASSALSLIESGAKVDLLFTDVIMPGGMSGYDLAEKVRAINPEIKILLTSGFTGDDSRHESQNIVLLSKPYNKSELYSAVKTVLDVHVENVKDDVVSVENNNDNDCYKMGYAIIDDDHDKLFKMLDAYRVAIDDMTVSVEADAILGSLEAYTKYHFMREEALMEACNYPNLDNHRRVHEMLMKMVVDLLNVYRQSPYGFDHVAAVDFLRHWLNEHIMGMDKDYGKYISGNEAVIEKALALLEVSQEEVVPYALKPKLIVLDDEVSMGEFVSEVAIGMGFEVSHFKHASEFILRHDDTSDAIVLDLLMPDMDGVEIIRLLAGMESRSSIILISGVDKSVLHSARELGYEHGLNIIGTLQKPFHPHELRKLLNDVKLIRAKNHKLDVASVVEPNTLKIDELQLAVNDSQLIPYYQPQVSISSKQVVGFEVLMRWNHPQRGILAPYYFIPLAESSGLINQMTWQLFEQVVIDWKKHELQQSVSINMTAGMFISLGLPEKLFGIAKKHDFTDCSKIILEVTESAVMEELTKSLDSLTRLRMKGYQLSIDDFGTGYSSMVQLYRAPFSELKIDQSFVMRMEDDAEAKAIVESTIDLAHNLNMKVVAEGVETQSILDKLESLGCDVAQGYHLARPMPIEDVPSWLESWQNKNT